MKNKNKIRGLGATVIDGKSYIFVCSSANVEHGTFTVRESEDGIIFKTITSNAKVINMTGPSDDLSQCNFFHVSKDEQIYYLTYSLCDEKKI